MASPKGTGLAALLSKDQDRELRRIIIDCVKIANKDLYAQVNTLEQKALKSEKDVTDLREKMAAAELEAALVKSKVTAVQKHSDQERHLISLLWERSQKALRLQNVEEEEGEIVGELVSRLLAPLAELPEPLFASELMSAYRVSTRYSEAHGLPREIRLKFRKEEIRGKILFNANKKQVEHQGAKIMILKDVPLTVRAKREPFKDLAKKLQDKGIIYRWLIPQGLSFNFKGDFMKITSDKDKERFLEKYKSEFTKEEASGTVSSKSDKEKEKAQPKTTLPKRELRPKKR